jgi:UDP-glucose 4-epimerase
MVIPNFVQRALLQEPIPVYGDGKQTRSFTHVADAVRAMTDLMRRPKARGEVVNIGSGEVISTLGLAEKVLRMTGSKSRIKFIPYRQIYAEGFEDMRARTPDIAKLRKLTGYRPKKSLHDILSDVIDHTQHHSA